MGLILFKEEPFNSHKDNNGFFSCLNQCYDIDLNCFLRWAMWPMGLLFKSCLKCESFSYSENEDNVYSYYGIFSKCTTRWQHMSTLSSSVKERRMITVLTFLPVVKGKRKRYLYILSECSLFKKSYPFKEKSGLKVWDVVYIFILNFLFLVQNQEQNWAQQWKGKERQNVRIMKRT